MIIVRQRGTKFHAGAHVGIGKDHTLFALKEGTVAFRKRRTRPLVEIVVEGDADKSSQTTSV